MWSIACHPLATAAAVARPAFGFWPQQSVSGSPLAIVGQWMQVGAGTGGAPAAHLAEQVGTACTARRPRTTARSMTTRARRSRARRAWTALGSYQPRVALARGLRIRTARKGTRALDCKYSPLANEAIVHATIYLSALVRQLPATCNKLGRSSVHGTCQPPAMPGLRQCILAYTLYMVGSYMCFANTSLSSVQAVHSTCLFPLCC